MHRTTKLKNAITNFENSDRLAVDYIIMFTQINTCMNMGGGLTWDEVEEVVKSTLGELYG